MGDMDEIKNDAALKASRHSGGSISMKTEDRIWAVAEEFAAQFQAKATRLRTDLMKARQRVAELEAEFDASMQAFKRLADFQVKREGEYQCARCGIFRGAQAAMKGRPGRHQLDLFKCDTCGFEMEAPQ